MQDIGYETPLEGSFDTRWAETPQVESRCPRSLSVPWLWWAAQKKESPACPGESRESLHLSCFENKCKHLHLRLISQEIGCLCAQQPGRAGPSRPPETCPRPEQTLPGKPWLRCLLARCPILPTNFLLPELQLAGTRCPPGKPARALLFPKSFSSPSKWSRSKPGVPQSSRGPLPWGPHPETQPPPLFWTGGATVP